MRSKWSGSLPYTKVAQDTFVDDAVEKENILSSRSTGGYRFWSFATSALLVALAGATGFLVGNQTSRGEPWRGNLKDTAPEGSTLILKVPLVLTDIL